MKGKVKKVKKVKEHQSSGYLKIENKWKDENEFEV